MIEVYLVDPETGEIDPQRERKVWIAPQFVVEGGKATPPTTPWHGPTWYVVKMSSGSVYQVSESDFRWIVDRSRAK